MNARVILKLDVLLCIVGVVIAVIQDNAYAASAWIIAIALAFGWLIEMSQADAANEDVRFWKCEFIKAQERYARTIPELEEPCQSKPDEERMEHERDKIL